MPFLSNECLFLQFLFVFGLFSCEGFLFSCKARYAVVKYIQADVVGVYNSAGTKVVTFTYDAYGNCTVSGDAVLAQYCKIRYRGYYFDTETGLYWVQTRYYNPQWCRWISPDSIGYLDPEIADGLNLYAYCINDPVNLYDPTGHSWDWNSFWRGLGYLFTGIGAIISGALVIACGVATLPMLLVAGITIAAGSLTTINGVSEVVDAGTGYNFIEDGLFAGNSSAYNTYATITGTVATVGSIVCGVWYKYNTPRIQAYKNIDRYDYTGTVKNYFPNRDVVMKGNMYRPYTQSTWAQRSIIKHGKMVKDPFGYKFIYRNAEIGVDNTMELIWHMLIRG